MKWLLERHGATLEDVVLLGSRLLLAWLFIHESVTLTTNFDAAASLVAKMGVPPPLLVATIALQFFGGIAIAIGCQARLAAAVLGLFCLATALLFHTNFTNRNELLHFDKDLAIAGGMFVLMIPGAGTAHWWRNEGNAAVELYSADLFQTQERHTDHEHMM
jgi:putative oxidoreductase